MTWNTLDPRARTLFYAQAAARFVLFGLPTTVALGVVAAGWIPWVWALGLSVAWLLLQLLLTIWMPALEWGRWAWVLREGDLLVSRGVIIHTMTVIPLRRVQHVDVLQGPLERAWGLSSVEVYTASGLGADVRIRGLLPEQAQELRERLSAAAGDDGV
jgi:membrane protein YdbS with pleckstrin-like domain